MDISLEIVPRSIESLQSDISLCRGFPLIGLVNIPDLLRFPLRSWEAVSALARPVPAFPASAFIPHLRARDFSPDAPFPHAALFRAAGIRKVLVISGDGEEKGSPLCPWDASPVLGFIKKLRTELPELEIYAAFDPYRTNIRYELDYLILKEEAGAAAFMSQPFFDLRLLEIYSEYLEGRRIFWGLSPVLSAGNRNYWESRNRAVFPKSFRADLEWNAAFGRSVLEFCRKNGFHLYLMPLKVDLVTYLSGIFGRQTF